MLASTYADVHIPGYFPCQHGTCTLIRRTSTSHSTPERRYTLILPNSDLIGGRSNEDLHFSTNEHAGERSWSGGAMGEGGERREERVKDSSRRGTSRATLLYVYRIAVSNPAGPCRADEPKWSIRLLWIKQFSNDFSMLTHLRPSLFTGIRCILSYILWVAGTWSLLNSHCISSLADFHH